jgi:hypothetical protein
VVSHRAARQACRDRDRGIVERRRQRQPLVERQIEQLLQPHEGDIAIGLPLNENRSLIVARNSRAEQLELRLIAHLTRQLRVTQCGLGLIEGRHRDCNEAIGQCRIVIRLDHVEHELRPRRRERGLGDSATGARHPCLRGHTPAREQRLLNVQAERPVVSLPEGQRTEVEARTRASCRVLQTRQALGGRSSGVQIVEAGRPERVIRVVVDRVERLRIPRRRVLGDILELRCESPGVAERGEDLRKQLAARPHLLTLRAIGRGASDADIFTRGFRNAKGIGQRQRPAGCDLLRRERPAEGHRQRGENG